MAAPAPDTPPRSCRDALLGIGFVLVWCTGYIAGKVAVAHAAPLTSLTLRFGIAALVFGALALVGRVGRCRRVDLLHSAATGVLMLALHFGAVYVAFQWGANAGVSALVIGAMPLLVALVATLDGSERLGAWRWFGMALGLLGVALVVADRVDGATPLKAWAMLALGLVGITAGTLYQKRHAAHLDMRLGLTVQNAAATLVLLPFALLEGFRFDDSVAFHGALAWLVLVNSIGGFALLFLLIRRGAATRVAALFFLMPPVTAVFGHLTLGEHLTWLKGAGFACAAIGVWLATRSEAPRAA
ncbi:DMT family transporter [Pseudoxanthomonas sp. USHLN014]|uniref:DMT family transporter n=1 Tax=Pseudoxanthomonas sp. USHLN014 TaxID=3081297 RepID=UPI00301E5EC0